MKKLTSYVSAIIFLFSTVGWVEAQINVSIPNSSADMGTSVSIPINVSEITTQDNVLAYQLIVTFDENVLDATGATSSGTLTAGWGSPTYNTGVNGKITVGGFTTSPLSGSGALVKLNFDVVGEPEETTNLSFQQFVFNAGNPAASTSGGTFTATGTLINITVTTSVGSGTKVIVDGVQKNAPYNTQWYANISHTIGVDSEQSGGSGVKHIYNSWNHGGAQNQTVTPSSATTYTANLDTKYYLTVTSSHDTPQGENWYNSGATANFSITSPADEAGGTRYRFTNWTGDYSGSNTSGSVTMDAPKHVTANWQTQYFLTTSENPANGGDISPNPTGDWYDSGTSAQVSASAASGYEFSNWSGALSGSVNPTQISMTGPKSVTANFAKLVQITVQTNPSGREFFVNGTPYTNSHTFTWVEGSQYTLSVNSPQSGATNTQYLFSSWSNGGNQTQTYTVPGSNQTVTANFTTQYYLTVNSSHDNPQGAGWYDSGTSANFSITTPADEVNGTRYVFSQWSGDYSGSNASASIVMNAPKEIFANWNTQYFLTVNSSHDNPQGQDWYNSGANANFRVSSPADESNGTRYSFTNWSGDHSGTNPSANIVMDDAKQVTANWQTQYFLTTAENPGAGGNITPSPQGEWYNSGANAEVNASVASGYEWAGWSGDLSGTSRPEYVLMNAAKGVTANFGKLVQITIQANPAGREFWVDGNSYNSTQVFSWVENSQHNLSVNSPQSAGAGTQYEYSSWSNGGAQNQTYIVPGSNQTVTANFTTQYYLTVTSAYDDPQGSGWYNAGSSANFSVTSPANELNGTRYVFTQWTGDYSGSSESGSITMNAPKQVVASWKTQYYLTVTSTHDTPQGQNWYNSGAMANFSVTTPADESGGIRYRFTNWSGDYSGTNSSASITMNAAKQVTANWQTQYLLTTSENPTAGGDITPSPPGEWYDDGTNANVDATVANGYQWAGWSGNLSGNTRPEQITMNASKSITANFDKLVQITIQANPSGRAFVVDGTNYTSTQIFTWVEGSEHTLSVTSPQSGATGTQYLYSSWSDGDSQTHIYTVPGTNQTVTANFTTQFYLTVTSLHDDPQGTGWYNSGTNANFSVTSPTEEVNGTRYVFAQWNGDYSGDNVSGSVIMNSPKEVIAGWNTQYYLTVTSSRDNPQGAGWYNSGTIANFSVTSPVAGATGTRYLFTLWSGDYSETNTSGTIVMSSSKTVVANWQTQYFLSTTENPDYAGNVTPAPPGEWYNSGVVANLSATPLNNNEWLGWAGDLSGDNNPTQITMNGPKSVTANFGGETVSKPNRPNGASNGITGQSLTYTTGGAVSNLGHSVEYRFNWGDGNLSGWGAATRSYVYSTKGDFSVRAQARCKTHTDVVSSWSSIRSVNITSYTLNVSANPSSAGNVSRTPNKSGYDYNESVQLKANATNGAYKFDHWSGNLSGSTNPKNIVMNGNKNVVAHFIAETVSPPNKPTGATNGIVGESLNFRTTGASSSLNHSIEYQFDWGDGNQSSWGAASVNYVFTNTGNFLVRARARCSTHTEIQSDWSETLNVTISGFTLTLIVNPDTAGYVTKSPDKDKYNYFENVRLRAFTTDNSYKFGYWEGIGGDPLVNPTSIIMKRNRVITANFIAETVSIPDIPSGPANGVSGKSITFVSGNAESSFGHYVEYQFNWGDGTFSDWGSDSNSHVYNIGGTMHVQARARCVDHNHVLSEWSEAHVIVISDFTLSVLINPAGTGIVTKNPNKEKYAEGEFVELMPMGEPGYSFNHWSGDLSGNDNPATIVINSNKVVTAFFSETEETVTKPTKLIGTDEGVMGKKLSYGTGGSSSNLGNEVEYQFFWGDSSLSEWGDSSKTHAYYISGQMKIKSRARSKANISIVSEWSDVKVTNIYGYKLTAFVDPVGTGNIIISPDQEEYADSSNVTILAEANSGFTFHNWTGALSGNEKSTILKMTSDKNITAHFVESVETVSMPSIPEGVEKAVIGQNLIFISTGAVNSLGNEVEYQFYWGDGSLSSWGANEREHIYFISDTMEVRARARSKINNYIITNWTDVHRIIIVGFKLTISIEPVGTGLVAINPNKIQYAYNDTVKLFPVGTQGYSFYHWNSVLDDTTKLKKIVMNKDTTIIANFISPTKVSRGFEESTKKYHLFQNYPNPFNPSTKIMFQVAEDCRINISIYNIKGQLINILVDEKKTAGIYTIEWNTVNQSGIKVPSGVYVYRFETDKYTQTRKMILLR